MAFTFEPDTMRIIITGAASGEGLEESVQSLIDSPDNRGVCESDYQHFVEGTVGLIDTPISVALESSESISRAMLTTEEAIEGFATIQNVLSSPKYQIPGLAEYVREAEESRWATDPLRVGDRLRSLWNEITTILQEIF